MVPLPDQALQPVCQIWVWVQAGHCFHAALFLDVLARVATTWSKVSVSNISLSGMGSRAWLDKLSGQTCCTRQLCVILLHVVMCLADVWCL